MQEQLVFSIMNAVCVISGLSAVREGRLAAAFCGSMWLSAATPKRPVPSRRLGLMGMGLNFRAMGDNLQEPLTNILEMSLCAGDGS